MAQKGFIPLVLIGIILVVFVLGASGYVITKNRRELPQAQKEDKTLQEAEERKLVSEKIKEQVEQKVLKQFEAGLKEPESDTLQNQPQTPKGGQEVEDQSILIAPSPSDQEVESGSASNGSAWVFRSWWGTCENKPVTFSVAPMDPAVIFVIEPLGKTHEGHVTPTDHLYIGDIIGWGSQRTYEVRVPADGLIVNMEEHDGRLFPGVKDYRIEIWYSCSVASIFIHTVDLPEDIITAAGGFVSSATSNHKNWGPSQTYPAIAVKAGQVIGKSMGTFDFSVHDTTTILTGFVNPSRYVGEAWKIHTVDPLPYFTESIRQKLAEKIPRTIMPLGGKIDYDIEGRLIGNWFLQGSSGGYESELAIVYDHIYPDITLVNMGGETGISEDACRLCQRVYGVKGNAPDPANVSSATGIIKYELVGRVHADDPKTGARVTVVDESNVVGTFLVEMLNERTIKVEVFPNKTISEVEGFTNAAKIYER